MDTLIAGDKRSNSVPVSYFLRPIDGGDANPLQHFPLSPSYVVLASLHNSLSIALPLSTYYSTKNTVYLLRSRLHLLFPLERNQIWRTSRSVGAWQLVPDAVHEEDFTFSKSRR